MKIHELIQGSPDWQAFRLNHHGASEAAAMLGLTKKMLRSELLQIKHTGIPKEFTDYVQEKILNHGHEVEALARPLVESLIGEDLYPVTCSNDDEGGNLSASCDGLTMLYDTAFEHKQWNIALADSVRAGELPVEYMPQCQQIMMITGAARVIFVVSDGTTDNFESLEVLPDPEWFERIRAGWAQFDKDLASYVQPEPKPVVVAEPVQALPAIMVQISGQIDVRENFGLFETALRDFLDNRLIREPQTDQDFADLDQQIKAMKKAEEMLNAAEAMMLAQIQSVDEAKRQKDMLAKLVRDNRLMAEKLLESEKARRRSECVDAARKAFLAHIAELQHEIPELRLNVQLPDFASAIKGLKTLTSIQDKLDTALANGKIAADQQAADIRLKLRWVADNASSHLQLLPDLQQLVGKPFDDFQLAVKARIDAHKKAESDRLEVERERIRREEAVRLEAEQLRNKSPVAEVVPEPVSVQAPEPVATKPASLVIPEASKPEPAQDGKPTLRLGQINERLSPIRLDADGLETLGFTPAAIEKAAKLYHERDFAAICHALLSHIQARLPSVEIERLVTVREFKRVEALP